MTTQVLEYLIAIEEEHSLTRAAERFYLSQPSLSYHLAKAEQELNVKLFQKKRALSSAYGGWHHLFQCCPCHSPYRSPNPKTNRKNQTAEAAAAASVHHQRSA